MFMHFSHNFNNVITAYAQVNEYQLCSSCLFMLSASHWGGILCYIKVKFVCLGRNFWPLGPHKIYNMGSKEEIIFVFTLWAV
jgi:hypothetical protein